ncbi:Unknown protein [Striga hermonthica]|uniref:DUF3741 domain-containing protein n=1 Tax=Striga hermonthica TaxID=68872 RepID=A0A9N7NB47_STRHE|nr:Unknown protein [Striga hermonthica]
MVREWLQWVGRRRRRSKGKDGEEMSSSGGCISAVFQIFDLQHHPFRHHTHFLHEQSTTKFEGLEAPRNSLEAVEEADAVKATSSIISQSKEEEEEEEVGINKIKTKISSVSTKEEHNYNASSDCSPGPITTPNLVARLMGLDLLPQSINSNSTPKAKLHIHKRTASDDIGIGARRKSGIEYHRLSLQINKETQFAISGKMKGKNATTFNKEKVRAAAGLVDITNTYHGDREAEKIMRRDKNLSLSHKNNNADQPRGILRDGNKVGVGNGNISSAVGKLQTAPQTFDYSIADQKSEAFVRKGRANNNQKKRKNVKKEKKKESASSEIVNVNGPTFLPVKKDPSPPATKLPQKQSQQVSDALSSKRSTRLSRNLGRSYKQASLQPDQISTVLPDRINGCATAPEYRQYIQKILKRAGLNNRFSPSTLGKWHTASHPLDPSIFYHLELAVAGGGAGILSRRCNRKLIFQLADELLAEILKPKLDFKPWADVSTIPADNLDMCGELCRRIGDFPAADCRVLEDIDSLIERDLRGSILNNGFLEEERERLVCEIEGEITEWLVRETAAVVHGGDAEEGGAGRRQVARAEGRRHVRLLVGNHPRGG